MRCPRCKHELHQAGQEREELRQLLSYLSGLVADYVSGLNPGAERFAQISAQSLIEQVGKMGIQPRRVFTRG